MPPPRNRAPSGSQSSFLVLAACAALLGGGWVWVNGGLGTSERETRAAAPEDDATGVAGADAGAASGLFGGLGGAQGETPAAVPQNLGQGVEEAAQEMGAAIANRPTPQWLAGAWVPKGNGCATDNALFFEANGNFSNLDRQGSWTLTGDVLTVIYQEAYPGDDLDPSSPRHTMRHPLAMLGTDDMQFGTDKFSRCK